MARSNVDRLAFERMLADLASRFADVPPAEVVQEIEAALQKLVQFFGYDRCTYSEFDDAGTIVVICSAAAPGIAPHAIGRLYDRSSWFASELLAGRPIVLPALPEGLPPQASREAEIVLRSGLRSHLSIPLHVRGRTTGVLSFGGFKEARDWPMDLIVRLTIIADVFATAVARARSDTEAQLLRNRLWHTDRVARVNALTAAIAHEINQPLAAILSNAQAALANLARGDVRPAELRAVLEAVVRDDKRAAETIRSMRALLRQDEGGRARIDLADALGEVLALLGTELGRRGVRVEARLEPGCWVNADRVQIEQVALNLVLNAAHAMESSPPDERVVHLRAARGGEGQVTVDVRDAGRGIAAEDLQSVFEPFWTTRQGGLGLGLAICRSIVEAHGGTIAVERNPGRGVTFRFELPADAAAARAPRPSPAAEPVAEPVVCVVDDDAAVREAMARLLSASGWSTAAYASAEEFLERQAPEAVGCLLLDYQMPGMTGLELQQRLAERGAAPPVVFLTGHGDLAGGVHAMKLGALDFLTKPADADQLVGVVRRALAQHAEARQRVGAREQYAARLARLSAREREVMDLVLRGRLNKQIAAELDIAIQTVKQHRGRVMEKMQVRSVAELARLHSRPDSAAEQDV